MSSPPLHSSAYLNDLRSHRLNEDYLDFSTQRLGSGKVNGLLDVSYHLAAGRGSGIHASRRAG